MIIVLQIDLRIVEFEGHVSATSFYEDDVNLKGLVLGRHVFKTKFRS